MRHAGVAALLAVWLLALPQHARGQGCDWWSSYTWQGKSVADVQFCLNAGSDPNARDSVGSTPLHWVALSGGAEVVMALSNAGADPNARNGSGQTPLHRAAFGGNLEVVMALLKAGAGPNARNGSGQTPLHRAAFGGNQGTLRLP
ncbi:MAG: ankyrin repeat domain-containing protein [Rhodobacteraceae bacterium]|nr:ankyrin repeat domain-containing protein [Paracoccaceae bacterium]